MKRWNAPTLSSSRDQAMPHNNGCYRRGKNPLRLGLKPT
jgi:hypothetical protein